MVTFLLVLAVAGLVHAIDIPSTDYFEMRARFELMTKRFDRLLSDFTEASTGLFLNFSLASFLCIFRNHDVAVYTHADYVTPAKTISASSALHQ